MGRIYILVPLYLGIDRLDIHVYVYITTLPHHALAGQGWYPVKTFVLTVFSEDKGFVSGGKVKSKPLQLVQVWIYAINQKFAHQLEGKTPITSYFLLKKGLRNT